MRNPASGIGIEDLARLVDYSSGVSLAKLFFDLSIAIGSGISREGPNIRSMATYFALVGNLNDEAWEYLHRDLWPAIASDPSFA